MFIKIEGPEGQQGEVDSVFLHICFGDVGNGQEHLGMRGRKI